MSVFMIKHNFLGVGQTGIKACIKVGTDDFISTGIETISESTQNKIDKWIMMFKNLENKKASGKIVLIYEIIASYCSYGLHDIGNEIYYIYSYYHICETLNLVPDDHIDDKLDDMINGIDEIKERIEKIREENLTNVTQWIH